MWKARSNNCTILHSQSAGKLLKMLTENVGRDEALVLGDIVESYKCAVQDELHGNHWNEKQCTLHAVVMCHHSTQNAIFHQVQYDIYVMTCVIISTWCTVSLQEQQNLLKRTSLLVSP